MLLTLEQLETNWLELAQQHFELAKRRYEQNAIKAGRQGATLIDVQEAGG